MLSILITHYNRPKALATCLNEFKKLKFNFPIEIVVSDDASSNENLNEIKKLSIDKLIVSSKNQGLASNLNKGILSCKGNYILYVQEDYKVNAKLPEILEESFTFLDSGKLEMVRLRSNYKFNHLISLSNNINKIPYFSWRNFNVNTFKYSDNPFVTKPDFFNKYGFYLENTSGPYGETEFAIRICKLKAKIGIASRNYFHPNLTVNSVINTKSVKQKSRFKKRIWRVARAIRQHFEWLVYNKEKRKLTTYKNKKQVN